MCTGFALAQTGTGTIQGTVSDASGAVLPDTKVSIKHTQTSREYTTTTTEVGFFIFPAMQVGAYQITVEASGIEGRTDAAGRQPADVNPHLTVAGTVTQVTVAGDVTPF